MVEEIEFKTVMGATFANVVKTINNLVDEGNFHFKKDGIILRTMDPAHVALVDLKLDKDFFEDYNCEEDFYLGIDLDELSKIASRVKDVDNLTISLIEEGKKLSLKFTGETTRIFTLPSISLEQEDLSRLEIDYNVKTAIDSRLLKQAIQDAITASEYTIISGDENGLKIQAKGERRTVDVLFEKNGTTVHEYSIEESSKSTYALDILSKIVKAAVFSQEVLVEFSTDMPIKFTFGLPHKSKLVYFLAPRIEKIGGG